MAHALAVDEEIVWLAGRRAADVTRLLHGDFRRRGKVTPKMFAPPDPKKLAAENKALRQQLNHLSEELVRANERIAELSGKLTLEAADAEAKESLLRQQRQQAESLVCDMAAREELISSLKEEIRRTDLKVQGLESQGKVRELELQRVIALAQRLQAQVQSAGSGLPASVGGDSAAAEANESLGSDVHQEKSPVRSPCCLLSPVWASPRSCLFLNAGIGACSPTVHCGASDALAAAQHSADVQHRLAHDGVPDGSHHGPCVCHGHLPHFIGQAGEVVL